MSSSKLESGHVHPRRRLLPPRVATHVDFVGEFEQLFFDRVGYATDSPSDPGKHANEKSANLCDDIEEWVEIGQNYWSVNGDKSGQDA